MIKKKNITVGNFTYIVEQPCAIDALALSALAQRIEIALSELAGGTGAFDGKGLKADLNELLKNNELIKITTGKSANGLTIAKEISNDTELPHEIVELAEFINEVLSWMFEIDETKLAEEGTLNAKK